MIIISQHKVPALHHLESLSFFCEWCVYFMVSEQVGPDPAEHNTNTKSHGKLAQ